MLKKITSIASNQIKKIFAIIEIITNRTQKRRWAQVAVSGPPIWDNRNKKIGRFIPPGSSVLDMGCGAQTLKAYLPTDSVYQPCDLVKSSPDTLQCDFNAGQYPQSDMKYSHIVCSGVLEYIRDHEQFLKVCATLGDTVIISYNVYRKGDSKLDRMANHWINHFSQSELEKLFIKSGLSGECINHELNGEVIYTLKSKFA